MGKTFQYQLFKNNDRTGKFELTLYKNSLLEGNGCTIHSKGGRALPSRNWNEFSIALSDAMGVLPKAAF